MLTNDIKRIYLNNAAGAYPLAPRVAETVYEKLLEPPRISGRDTSASCDSLFICRAKSAEIMQVGAGRTVLTPGATYGLNAAILGLGLGPGDLAVTTAAEHSSVLRPLALLSRTRGIRTEYVPLTGEAKLDKNVYDSLLKQKPRLVALTHASNVTGRINPVRQWFSDAKSVGAVTLLDAGQTVGRIPVLPDGLYADIAVFPGHKGLRGPLGTGVMYVSPDIELEPVFTGGTGIRSDLLSHPSGMPVRLEAGTPNTPAFAGLYTALCHYEKEAARITAYEAKIFERLYEGLARIPGVCVFDNDTVDRLPVISFTLKNTDAETAGYMLSESFGIECRAGLHCAPLMHKALGVKGTVRFSPSYMNTMDDIDYAVDAVRKVAK